MFSLILLLTSASPTLQLINSCLTLLMTKQKSGAYKAKRFKCSNSAHDTWNKIFDCSSTQYLIRISFFPQAHTYTLLLHPPCTNSGHPFLHPCAGNTNPYLVSYIRRHSSPDDIHYVDGIWIQACMLMGQGVSMFAGGIIEHRLGPRIASLVGCWCLR